ncbi:MAG TPA: thiamine pyrophosphate-binding protein, partial [Candidatus Tripitaka californicus]
MKASELLVRCLEHEGVQFVFGVSGEEVMDVLDSLRSSRIKYVTTRHEQGAAYMAGVVGRLTGKPGVCLATLGPGATNLTT